jgi:hypothetical protein
LKSMVPFVDDLVFLEGSTCVTGICPSLQFIQVAQYLPNWDLAGLRVVFAHVALAESGSTLASYINVARNHAIPVQGPEWLQLVSQTQTSASLAILAPGNVIPRLTGEDSAIDVVHSRILRDETKIQKVAELQRNFARDATGMVMPNGASVNWCLVDVIDLWLDAVARDTVVPAPSEIEIDEGTGNPIVMWNWADVDGMKHAVYLFLREFEAATTHRVNSSLTQANQRISVASYTRGTRAVRCARLLTLMQFVLSLTDVDKSPKK